MQVPPFHGNISFNAHHSPMGAFFTFTCGHFGTKGGLAAQLGKPGNQDVFIGVKDGGRHVAGDLRCLPFYEGAKSSAQDAYLVEQAAGESKKSPRVVAYGKDQMTRHYAWATDTWKTAEFEFSIYTPFDGIPDPAASSSASMRSALIPAVTAELIVDNRKGTQTKTGFFALSIPDPGVRMLDEGLPRGRVGFALRSHMGFAAELVELKADGMRVGSDESGVHPFAFMRWTPQDGIIEKDNPVHLLGSTPGIGFEVPAGKTYILRLAFGCYLEGNVTTRLEGRYLYTRYFASLQDVLNEALAGIRFVKVDCNTHNDKLLLSGLNRDQQFLIAHATRSYYGSTQLLEIGGQPWWVVNEGEYCMINTLDLSVDHVFWELKWNPWVVRNLLNNFAGYYSYHDEVKDPKTGALRPGGISFCHDQGVNNQFSPRGRSSYELAEISGCFSHMTAEQLCNWLLIAGSYVTVTKDAAWAQENRHLIDACYRSLVNRGPEHGLIEFDSSRCGRGAEITTYDSLDHSLAQTRNNLYMAVKTWASYKALVQIYGAMGDTPETRKNLAGANEMAERIVARLKQEVLPDGSLPAVFEKENPGYPSRILPAVEGLVYPLAWGVASAAIPVELLELLKRHTASLLKDGQNRNKFSDGGVKLSSTSVNSWASKIALFQHVARELFNIDENGDARAARGDGAGWEKADAAHTHWQVDGESGYWACSDQMLSGVAKGSKYYPRIITTALWMKD